MSVHAKAHGELNESFDTFPDTFPGHLPRNVSNPET
jgi:hypothetical protein